MLPVVSQLKSRRRGDPWQDGDDGNAFYGPGKTRNPPNLRAHARRLVSGSAAAVADFEVPIALGTQTAGSIIRPASALQA